MYLCTAAYGSQQRGSDRLKLESQAVGRNPTWVLGTELVSQALLAASPTLPSKEPTAIV